MPDPVAAHLAWLRQRGLSNHTIYDRSRVLHRLRQALPVPLLAATEDDLAVWRETLNHLSGHAVATYCGHVKCFYDFAVAEGLIKTNPAARLPVPSRPRGIPRPIGEEELAAALASAPPRIRPWLVLAGWAGLRACEIARLRRERVLDMAHPPLLLIASDATKGRNERLVPLSAFVLAELHAAGLPHTGWLFRRYDGKPGPNIPWVISRLSNEHLHACGTDATLHQLRHRFGSSLYRETHDLRLVQELLGHQSPKTTAGYAAYDRSGALDAVNALPSPLRRGPGGGTGDVQGPREAARIRPGEITPPPRSEPGEDTRG